MGSTLHCGKLVVDNKTDSGHTATFTITTNNTIGEILTCYKIWQEDKNELALKHTLKQNKREERKILSPQKKRKRDTFFTSLNETQGYHKKKVYFTKERKKKKDRSYFTKKKCFYPEKKEKIFYLLKKKEKKGYWKYVWMLSTVKLKRVRRETEGL